MSAEGYGFFGGVAETTIVSLYRFIPVVTLMPLVVASSVSIRTPAGLLCSGSTVMVVSFPRLL